jgi:uncharacterized protein YifN (PemK superfamily)
MTKSVILDKYHVNSLEITKEETSFKNVDDFLNYFQDKIEKHPIAKLISIFDHYSHTTSIDGEINPDIKDAKNIIFCFGSKIPNTKILAARPRVIAVAELEKSFIVEFMDAPNAQMHCVMEDWCKDMVK